MAGERNQKNIDKGKYFLCLGAEDVKQILLDFLQTRNWRMNCVNGKWVNINKRAAYREVIRCSNKDRTRNVGRYLDKIKCKLCNKQSNVNTYDILTL